MKKIIILFAFLIASQTLSAYTLSDYDLGINSIISASKFGKKIAVLGMQKDYNSSFAYTALRMYENGNWDSIQTSFILHDTTKNVLTTIMSQIHFDSLGTIWLSGDMMYAYKDGKYSAFFIDDSLKQWREYNQFCVDAYNNLWIMTSIFNQSRHDADYQGYSELLKFDGQTFKTVLFTKSFFSFYPQCSMLSLPNPIAALKDGRVAVYRYWINNNDLKYDTEKYSHLFLYNQDGSYSCVQVRTISGDKYKGKGNVSSIFADDDNTLWLSLDKISWLHQIGANDYSIQECCSGLIAYKNNDWLVLDEKNGMPVERSDSFALAEAVYRVSQIDKWNYFVLTPNHFYSMGKDYVLKKLDIKDIGEKSLLIKANKFCTADYYNYNINYKFDSIFCSMDISSECIVNDDEIWLINEKGIIVMPKAAAVLGIAGGESTETNSIVFPVPSHDYIQIKSLGIYDNYTIFNQLGEIIQSGRLDGFNTQIDISTFSDGMYYIRLSNKLNQQVYKFIKE